MNTQTQSPESLATRAKKNSQRLNAYILDVAVEEEKKFQADFSKLSRKIQRFIVELVKNYNESLKRQSNLDAELKYVISWLDHFFILNYSNDKIIYFVTGLYLKD